MRLIRAGLPVLALMFALTACGGSDSGTQPTGSSQSQDTLLKYAQCMRDNGVPVPDPIAGDAGSMYKGVDQDSASFKTADGVCGPILQGVVQDRKNHGGQDQNEQQQKLLALAQCLRDHGVNVPDPVAGQEKPFGDSLNRSDPNVSKAIQTCNQAAPTTTKQG
jgi:hypothetical protein